MDIIDLCGKWELENLKSKKTYTATVPGLNFLDLMENGEIDDPYTSKNEEDYFFISETTWKYTKRFSVSKELLNEENAVLHFERLDTLAEIYLNGTEVSKTANIHRSYNFPVKKLLKEGENILEVTFLSIRDYLKEKQKENKLPYNSNGTQGHPHIRKCGCHFGWDFAGEFDMQGIGGKCSLNFYSHSLIENFYVKQKLFSSNAQISVFVSLSEEKEGNSLSVTLTDPLGNEETKILEKAQKENQLLFSIDEPKLWWPNGLGAQPLYKISVSLSENGKEVQKQTKQTGLRKIKLNRENGDFHFFVNGVPIFAKGANYVPMDLFYTRITKERLYELLYKCKEANMNMVRAWGGGFYESEDFYDICDELGLLVWQDFAFACCAYPFYDKAFMENVTKEVEENVKRIMHRASLALWCGNNEIESMSPAWITRKDCINSTGEFFYKILPSLIRLYDEDTPYHECSPGSGKYMKLSNSDKKGDTHIWNVWHGFQSKNYFQKRSTRFCSEFGMQSYPSKNVTPHQKCDLGEERLTYYLSKHFTLPKTQKEKIYLTQLLQLEAMKEGVEHFRRNMKNTHGALFWQLNDCFHAVSWSAVDYLQNKKALMYAAKGFCEDVHISARLKKGKVLVFVSNDKKEAFKGKAIISVAVMKEKEYVLLEKEVDISPTASKEIASFKKEGEKTQLISLRLYNKEKKLISENRFAMCDNCELKLQKPEIKIETTVKNGKFYVSIASDTYARYVFLETESSAEFSENFFDLSPYEQKNVEIKNMGVDDTVSAISLYDCLCHKNRPLDFFSKLKVSLMPMSIANRVSRWFDK